jgi:hypothetical protein
MVMLALVATSPARLHARYRKPISAAKSQFLNLSGSLNYAARPDAVRYEKEPRNASERPDCGEIDRKVVRVTGLGGLAPFDILSAVTATHPAHQ